MDLIPSRARHRLLPSKHLPVSDFLLYDVPSPLAAPRTKLLQAEKYLSAAIHTSDDPHQISLLVPPPDHIVAELQSLLQTSAARSVCCLHDISANEKTYPLWLVTYWAEIKNMHTIQRRWASAVLNLENRLIADNDRGRKLVLRILTAVNQMPWNGVFHGMQAQVPTHSLTAFLSTKWLTDDHESLMLEVLEHKVAELHLSNQVWIQSPFFITLLKAAYNDRDEYDSVRIYEWLRVMGQDAAKQEGQLVTIANNEGNHWTGIAIDFSGKGFICNGDSMGHTMEPETKAALEWWTQHHTGRSFIYQTLPTTQQQDGHSCGILVWNTIAHFLLPDRHALMDASKMKDACLQVFMLIINHAILRATEDEEAAQTELDADKDWEDIDMLDTTSSNVAQQSVSEPASTHTPEDLPHGRKRSLSPSPPCNPSQPHPIPQKKAKRLASGVSSVQVTLSAAEESMVPTYNILNYFKLATKEEHQQYIAKAAEDAQINTETRQWEADKHLHTKAENTRARA
ncbi:hypothetical protein DXG01_008659 [Tephrocybe rancida]|nr:hypothetical protein DXG01_008659 [Tephrocybe rancida]